MCIRDSPSRTPGPRPWRAAAPGSSSSRDVSAGKEGKRVKCPLHNFAPKGDSSVARTREAPAAIVMSPSPTLYDTTHEHTPFPFRYDSQAVRGLQTHKPCPPLSWKEFLDLEERFSAGFVLLPRVSQALARSLSYAYLVFCCLCFSRCSPPPSACFSALLLLVSLDSRYFISHSLWISLSPSCTCLVNLPPFSISSSALPHPSLAAIFFLPAPLSHVLSLSLCRASPLWRASGPSS
eukprot:1447302-Rhodomonas_salina.1